MSINKHYLAAYLDCGYNRISLRSRQESPLVVVGVVVSNHQRVGASFWMK